MGVPTGIRRVCGFAVSHSLVAGLIIDLAAQQWRRLSRTVSLNNLSKFTYWILLVLGGLFLLQYWTQFFIRLSSDEPVSHQTYWGADVGTYLLLGILVVATPFYVYMAWKNWPRRRAGNR